MQSVARAQGDQAPHLCSLPSACVSLEPSCVGGRDTPVAQSGSKERRGLDPLHSVGATGAT